MRDDLLMIIGEMKIETGIRVDGDCVVAEVATIRRDGDAKDLLVIIAWSGSIDDIRRSRAAVPRLKVARRFLGAL